MSNRNSVIRRYKVRRSGHRGATITLPAEWLDDTGLAPGDRVEMLRDTEDRLILVAKKEALDENGIRDR